MLEKTKCDNHDCRNSSCPLHGGQKLSEGETCRQYIFRVLSEAKEDV